LIQHQQPNSAYLAVQVYPLMEIHTRDLSLNVVYAQSLALTLLVLAALQSMFGIQLIASASYAVQVKLTLEPTRILDTTKIAENAQLLP